MDTDAQVRDLRGRKGFAVVWLALVIPIILLFAVFAVDFGYMYMAKGQLQNAADAAALAGAAKLDYSSSTIQSAARAEAVKFALANQAARLGVHIANDGSNDFSETNDIRFGYWNGSDFIRWGDAGIPAEATINALQVKARRTSTVSDSQQPQVGIFFGKLFGWDRMSATATATAGIVPHANVYTSICFRACSSATYSSVPTPENTKVLDPPRVLTPGPGQPYEERFAWTSLNDQVTSTSVMEDLICGNTASVSACGKSIYSTMGVSSTFKKLESVFYDPLTPKDSAGGWWVIIPVVGNPAAPVTDSCPPGTQPAPLPVTRYALVRIIRVCASGGGQGCPGRSTVHGTPGCSGGENSIVIDRIGCVECSNAPQLFGLSPTLLK